MILKKFQEENAIRKNEKKRKKLEEEANQDILKQQMIEKKKEKIQLEKDRLLSLNDKELMVESIFAIRGFYNKVSKIESQQEEIIDRIKQIEADLASLESDVSNLDYKVRTNSLEKE